MKFYIKKCKNNFKLKNKLHFISIKMFCKNCDFELNIFLFFVKNFQHGGSENGV